MTTNMGDELRGKLEFWGEILNKNTIFVNNMKLLH